MIKRKSDERDDGRGPNNKPPITFVIGGLLSPGTGSRPRVPLHFELCTVCRFSQCCFTALMLATPACPPL